MEYARSVNRVVGTTLTLFVRLRLDHFAVLVVGQITLDDRIFFSRCALADAYEKTLKTNMSRKLKKLTDRDFLPYVLTSSEAG